MAISVPRSLKSVSRHVNESAPCVGFETSGRQRGTRVRYSR